MNTTKIENDGLDYVKRYFRELGGWPVLEQVWNEKRFEWRQLLYRLRRSGWRPVTFFIQLQIEPDMMNSSRRMLTVMYIYMTLWCFRGGAGAYLVATLSTDHNIEFGQVTIAQV